MTSAPFKPMTWPAVGRGGVARVDRHDLYAKNGNPPRQQAGRAGGKKSSRAAVPQVTKYRTAQPDATPIVGADADALITIDMACEVSGEKPAVIIGWCAHDKIGKHVKSGRGHGGEWLVDADALERLLAGRAVAS